MGKDGVAQFFRRARVTVHLSALARERIERMCEMTGLSQGNVVDAMLRVLALPPRELADLIVEQHMADVRLHESWRRAGRA